MSAPTPRRRSRRRQWLPLFAVWRWEAEMFFPLFRFWRWPLWGWGLAISLALIATPALIKMEQHVHERQHLEIR